MQIGSQRAEGSSNRHPRRTWEMFSLVMPPTSLYVNLRPSRKYFQANWMTKPQISNVRWKVEYVLNWLQRPPAAQQDGAVSK